MGDNMKGEINMKKKTLLMQVEIPEDIYDELIKEMSKDKWIESQIVTFNKNLNGRSLVIKAL